MPFNIIVKEEAHQDSIDAYNYYEEKSIGLGERFLESLQKRYNDLSLHPTHYSFINEDASLKFRDVLLDKFPYVIVFEIAEKDVIVYAIHNTYKIPQKKIRR